MRKISLVNKKTLFYFVVFLIIVEGIISFVATVRIPPDAKNAFLFGFSIKRLLILSFQIFCIAGFSAALNYAETILDFLSTRFNSAKANKIITSAGLLSFFLLWITIFMPAKDFRAYEAVFIRSRPTFIWLELILLQLVLWTKYLKKTYSLEIEKSPVDTKTLALAFFPLCAIWVAISASKIGLISDTAYWNVPGIPLSTLQFIGVLLFLLLALIFSSGENDTPGPFPKVVGVLLPIIIYVATVIIWGSTPLLKHYFSLQSTLPNMQPYPYSDARVHDLGALSIVMGKGIYFHGYTDKPMYMLLLAILHVFTGDDYNLLQWAQIFVLAFSPVILFLFGRKYFGMLFGIASSVMLLFQQRNSIELSPKIVSVNPKLLVTEETMLLGIIALTYLLFHWVRSSEPKKIFLLGGLIGVLSLVRINPIFIAPVVVALIIIKFKNTPGLLFKQTVFFCLGFLLVFSPWLFTGVSPEGKSWFFLKIQDVIRNRYPILSEIDPPQEPKIVSVSFSDKRGSSTRARLIAYPTVDSSIKDTAFSADGKTDELAWVMFNHFLHNYSTSLLALPDSIVVKNLSDLGAREYWQDENRWSGSFPFGQYSLILVNLLIVGAGIALSWKKYQWAGMVPLLVFLAYDLSLSAAINSGSRYIVPINWIVFFYYTLGLILICRAVLNLLGIKSLPEFTEIGEFELTVSDNSFKSWFPPVAILVFFALLLPFANFVVPKLVHPEGDAVQFADYEMLEDTGGSQLINGIILYPYYEDDGRIFFSFLADAEVTSYRVATEYVVAPDPVILENRAPALLSVTRDDGKVKIQSIYLLENNTPVLFWHSD